MELCANTLQYRILEMVIVKCLQTKSYRDCLKFLDEFACMFIRILLISDCANLDDLVTDQMFGNNPANLTITYHGKHYFDKTVHSYGICHLSCLHAFSQLHHWIYMSLNLFVLWLLIFVLFYHMASSDKVQVLEVKE